MIIGPYLLLQAELSSETIMMLPCRE